MAVRNDLPRRFNLRRPWALPLSAGAIVMIVAVRAVLIAPPFNIELDALVTSGLSKPVYLTHAGDGSGRLFVVELPGRIRIIRDGQLLDEPFLDITHRVMCCQEQGLFSMAFDPDYQTNGVFYISYSDLDWDTVIARYVARDPAADAPQFESVTRVIHIEQPYFNHNGGQLQFGPDGYLYVGMGDGGGVGDPENRGQALDTLLGKLLRLDVRGVPTYTLPHSNPLTQTVGARPEIWAYGLRNPWRFSFDRVTGDLYIADVGVACFEEVNVEPAGGPGGRNYGWRVMEGLHAFDRDGLEVCTRPRIAPPGVTLPVAEYDRHAGNAIVGGYVYRGRQYPWMRGAYLYGDFGTGRIWALQRDASGAWANYELIDTPYVISSFGEDEAGELYVLDFGEGQVFRIASTER